MAGDERNRRLEGWAMLATVLIVPMLIYAAVSIGGRWLQTRGLVTEAEMLREDVIKARADNQRLQTAIAHARTDQAIEAIAREELGLIRPGDTPVVILAPPGTPTPALASRTASPTPRP